MSTGQSAVLGRREEKELRERYERARSRLRELFESGASPYEIYLFTTQDPTGRLVGQISLKDTLRVTPPRPSKMRATLEEIDAARAPLLAAIGEKEEGATRGELLQRFEGTLPDYVIVNTLRALAESGAVQVSGRTSGTTYRLF